MSNGASGTTATASVLAALIAAANMGLTTCVNTTFQAKLERAKGEIQTKIKESEQHIEQQKTVTGIENDAYLKRLPQLEAAIEADLAFAENVTEGTVAEKARDQTAERLRIRVRLLTAACEARPRDAQLASAARSLNTTVDLLRQSIIAETIDQDYGTRITNLIDAWKTFQAEVFRVAEQGYHAQS